MPSMQPDASHRPPGPNATLRTGFSWVGITEAYAWQVVAYVAGSAIGAWLAGILVDELGVQTALAGAPLAAGIGLLVALTGYRRRRLRIEAPAN